MINISGRVVKLSVINPNSNYELANSGKLVKSNSNKMIKVDISENARDYILDRDGAITVEIRTTSHG